ncbi:hypothetical protein [Salinisphaera sp. Q1T1-3]|uniref:hypothetical protein n=1 Tax=Salinisphaera sp. Q1T1-3 TaxID=2321229 RepID=UPI000E762170|nr:hypothetical protein [Salinisphaera sp. Q1T1-3]RJS93519.1 hypothetical protein D3260_07495 [Salinisphaera sp. Q1T1-3]
MTYADDTPMRDVLAGMAGVDAEACQEFARRQAATGHGADLAVAAALLHDLAFAAQLDRPDELMRWKDPETQSPLDPEQLMTLLQHCSEKRRDDAGTLIAGMSFADISALSSIASYLAQACAQLRRFGTRPPDPQQSLF